MKYKAIELFAGAGGLALGVERAGVITSYSIHYTKLYDLSVYQPP